MWTLRTDRLPREISIHIYIHFGRIYWPFNEQIKVTAWQLAGNIQINRIIIKKRQYDVAYRLESWCSLDKCIAIIDELDNTCYAIVGDWNNNLKYIDN